MRNCVTVTVRKRTTKIAKGVNTMKMIDAREISELMGVSMATAYKIIRQLNADLKANGCRTVQGRTSREYFEKAYFSMPAKTTKGGD